MDFIRVNTGDGCVRVNVNGIGYYRSWESPADDFCSCIGMTSGNVTYVYQSPEEIDALIADLYEEA